VTPERIILLALNKQAAEELKERAAKSFERLGMGGVSVEASTFHAPGLRIIGKATGEKPDIPDWAIDTVSGFHKLTDIIDQLKDRSPAFRTQWDLFRFVLGRDLPPFRIQRAQACEERHCLASAKKMLRLKGCTRLRLPPKCQARAIRKSRVQSNPPSKICIKPRTGKGRQNS
jgi:hypothetical protein